jgi:hypothetical protein
MIFTDEDSSGKTQFAENIVKVRNSLQHCALLSGGKEYLSFILCMHHVSMDIMNGRYEC